MYIQGIDISKTRIEQAQEFFDYYNASGKFICQNFITANKPQSEDDRFDLIKSSEVNVNLIDQYDGHRLFETVRTIYINEKKSFDAV